MQKSIRYIFLAAMAALLIFVLTSCIDPQAQSSEGEKGGESSQATTVDILKIGKADAIIIDTGSEIIMVDTGEAENFPTIEEYMRGNGYTKIDKLILTHYDKDHIGSATEIINSYGVEAVYESRFTKSSNEYYSYHNAITDKGVQLFKLYSDLTFESGACKIEINVPRSNKYSNDNDNNRSLVVSVTIGEHGMLLLGDALDARIDELLDGELAHYNAVKLPHHGSYIENLSTLLAKIEPTYAIATDSKKNPTDERTKNELDSLGILLYKTSNGGVHVEITSDGVSIFQ